jgi:hypothetical protein
MTDKFTQDERDIRHLGTLGDLIANMPDPQLEADSTPADDTPEDAEPAKPNP